MSEILPLSTLFYIQLFSSIFMTGLIWFVQIVHYPMFADIDPKNFIQYSNKHQRLTTWVVCPIMLAEVFSALLLSVQFGVLWVNFAMIFGIWLSTACLQVPLHGRLSNGGYDISTIQSLVRGNWIRTILWTLKSILLLLSIVDFA